VASTVPEADALRRSGRELGVALQLHAVSTLAEARARLGERLFDVALVDLQLPDGDGLDLVEVPGASGRLVACVGIVEAGDTAGALAALGCGAQDCVERGCPPQVLVRALVFAARRARAALSPAREARCVLRASIEGVGGAEAVVREPGTGRSHRVRSDNRAVLLYLLGRKLSDDRRQGLSEVDAGWLGDRDVVIGIWGRGGEQAGRNRLHVLVHRTRKEVQDAGIRPAVLETRRSAIRGRFSGVELD
jgi:DNA-binding response OmpR family regulator